MSDKPTLPPAVAEFALEQLAAKPKAIDHIVAANRLRQYIGKASFAHNADRQAALEGVDLLAADNCEVLRARLARYEDSQGVPIAKIGGVDERSAFEAAHLKANYPRVHSGELSAPPIFVKTKAGEYDDPDMERTWIMWQARAALSAPSHGEQVRHMVPAGWKLVPVEPTREMISAASGAITTPDDLPPAGAGRWSMSDIAFRSRYRAALAAAPSAGSQGGDV